MAHQELPGTRIRPDHPFCGYDGPAYVLLDGMALHVQYTRTDADGGPLPPAPVSQGFRITPGGQVLNFLGSSLRRLFASEASVSQDGVIQYRQSVRHSFRRFEPDPAAGVLIRHPEQQVTAPAFMITQPGGDRVLWSRYAMVRAVEVCRRPAPIDWPDGWARLLPDGTLRFARSGFPWAAPEQWSAQPVTDPGDFGAPCADCQHYRSDHTPGYPWSRYRRNKQECARWNPHPTR